MISVSLTAFGQIQNAFALWWKSSHAYPPCFPEDERTLANGNRRSPRRQHPVFDHCPDHLHRRAHVKTVSAMASEANAPLTKSLRQKPLGQRGVHRSPACHHAVVKHHAVGVQAAALAPVASFGWLAPRKNMAPGTFFEDISEIFRAHDRSASSVRHAASPNRSSTTDCPKATARPSQMVTGKSRSIRTSAEAPCAAAMPGPSRFNSVADVFRWRGDSVRIVPSSEAVSGMILSVVPAQNPPDRDHCRIEDRNLCA